MAKAGWVLVVGLMVAAAAHADDARIAFPADYKSTFTNYLNLDRVQNHDQIIHLFANDVALDAVAAGKELPNGSILVGEIYAARKDKDGNVLTSALGLRIRDKLAAIAVMQKEDGWGAHFPDEMRNGDWDFAIFSPDGKRLDKDLNACRQCHAPLTDKQHVFSIEHLAR
jgi:hypothetical protein